MADLIPVLIIGGGPVGLALALDLGWRGVPCLLVEQSDGEIVDAKMFMTGIRTLEFCRRWGIAEQVKNWGISPRPADRYLKRCSAARPAARRGRARSAGGHHAGSTQARAGAPDGTRRLARRCAAGECSGID